MDDVIVERRGRRRDMQMFSSSVSHRRWFDDVVDEKQSLSLDALSLCPRRRCRWRLSLRHGTFPHATRLELLFPGRRRRSAVNAAVRFFRRQIMIQVMSLLQGKFKGIKI